MAEAGVSPPPAPISDAARQESARMRADRDGLIRNSANLRLIAPVDGLVTDRNADPGTTVVAGQSVVEVIDPTSLWINVRFDQLRVSGLSAGLPVHIVLRSQGGTAGAGACCAWSRWPMPSPKKPWPRWCSMQCRNRCLPSVNWPRSRSPCPRCRLRPVVPNASVQRVDGRLGCLADQDKPALCADQGGCNRS